MSEPALGRPPWLFVVGRALMAALLAWAFTRMCSWPISPRRTARRWRASGGCRCATLGPRDLRVLGVRPARHGGDIRVMGARGARDWTPGQPVLGTMQPFTLPPGEYGDLAVLLSDPRCEERTEAIGLPLDVRFDGGTSRTTIRVPRCR